MDGVTQSFNKIPIKFVLYRTLLFGTFGLSCFAARERHPGKTPTCYRRSGPEGLIDLWPCLNYQEEYRTMPDKGPLPEVCPETLRTPDYITAADLIRQYHERVDLSPLLSDEDFEGLVL